MTTNVPPPRLLVPTKATTPERSVLGRSSLGTSLLLALPLLFVYEIGLLVQPYGANGVDLVTRFLARFVDSRTEWLLLNLGLVALLGYVIHRKRDKVTARLAARTVGEGVAWAAVLAVMTYAILRAYRYGDTSGGEMHFPLDFAIVASAGAGFHEELVFRLVVMGGIGWILRAYDVRHGAAVLVALLGSAVIFAAAHHAGPGGEPFTWVAFSCRTSAGLLLGLVAYHRSLATAVYTHFLYDVFAFTAS